MNILNVKPRLKDGKLRWVKESNIARFVKEEGYGFADLDCILLDDSRHLSINQDRICTISNGVKLVLLYKAPKTVQNVIKPEKQTKQKSTKVEV